MIKLNFEWLLLCYYINYINQLPDHEYIICIFYFIFLLFQFFQMIDMFPDWTKKLSLAFSWTLFKWGLLNLWIELWPYWFYKHFDIVVISFQTCQVSGSSQCGSDSMWQSTLHCHDQWYVTAYEFLHLSLYWHFYYIFFGMILVKVESEQ